MKRTLIICFILTSFIGFVNSQQDSVNQRKTSYFSLNFSSGIGLMKPKAVFTNANYEGMIVPKVSLMTEFGMEAEFSIIDQISIYSGYFLQKKSYKEGIPNYVSSAVYGYSYTFPLFVRYNFSNSVKSPYVSMGTYFNLENKVEYYSSIGRQNGLLIDQRNVLEYNNLSVGFEIGKRFRIKKMNFSYSIHYNYSWQESFTSEFKDLAIDETENQNIGYGTSNGSALGMRLKYHFGLFDKQVTSRGTSIKNKSDKEKLYKNYFAFDLAGVSYIYAFSYERFLYRKNWVHLSLKTGGSYVPEYEEKGVVVNDRDATKLMGLFLPNSINLYVGKTNSFIHLGQAIIFTYSPYYYPEFHDSDYAWVNYFASILGYRYEYKKWAFNAQFNFQFSSPIPFGGISIARAI